MENVRVAVQLGSKARVHHTLTNHLPRVIDSKLASRILTEATIQNVWCVAEPRTIHTAHLCVHGPNVITTGAWIKEAHVSIATPGHHQ